MCVCIMDTTIGRLLNPLRFSNSYFKSKVSDVREVRVKQEDDDRRPPNAIDEETEHRLRDLQERLQREELVSNVVFINVVCVHAIFYSLTGSTER